MDGNSMPGSTGQGAQFLSRRDEGDTVTVQVGCPAGEGCGRKCSGRMDVSVPTPRLPSMCEGQGSAALGEEKDALISTQPLP